MKIHRNALFRLSIFLISLVLVINPLNVGSFPGEKANAQSSLRPFVVFVNGYENGRAWGRYSDGSVDPLMDTVVESLPPDSEIWYVPWDRFENGADQRSRTSNDAEFLRQGADFINNQLDPRRPLILIGHSFGGDSLLSLAPRINRRIQFLGVIDPTAAGGLREPITRREVPSNVAYFFNRWQENAVNAENVVPFDSRVISGYINNCRAETCNQEEQSLARNSDGSEITVNCESWEVSCSGYQPWPGGSNGTKAKRLAHNNMPSDEYLQRQMVGRISEVITSFNASSNSINAAVDKSDIAYFFNGSEYTAWDVARGQVEPGGPKSIARFWPGIFPGDIDAAVEKSGVVYFFKGAEYIGWDVARGQVEPGGPKSIARFWPGIFPGDIDAAVEKSGVVYFFKGAEYIGWDVARGQVEPGGPKSIARFWPGMFSSDIDAAVEKQGIVYFFKGSEYTAWDIARGQAEPGGVKSIARFWPGILPGL